MNYAPLEASKDHLSTAFKNTFIPLFNVPVKMQMEKQQLDN